jgi:multisubunit Na+/H+ antiporter MnhE subunit
MNISVSNDFVLGLVIGVGIVLLFQQLTRATSGLGRWLPLLLLILIVMVGVVLLLSWLGN